MENLFDVKDELDEYGELITAEDVEETEDDEDTEEETETQETQEEGTVDSTTQTSETEDPEKKVQSPEENARFAEQRRQKQRDQIELEVREKLMKESPEFQLAQQLSLASGKPVGEMLDQIKQAMLQKEAQTRNVPVEMLQEQLKTQEEVHKLRQEIVQEKFQAWKREVDDQGAKIKNTFPVLTDAEVDEAKLYLLEELKNPNIPLEKAVFALHGPKIMEYKEKIALENAKGQISGRAKSFQPPSGGKAPEQNHLTDDQRSIAKRLRVSEDDYAKYSDPNMSVI